MRVWSMLAAGLGLLLAGQAGAHPGHGPELAGLAHDWAQALATAWPLGLVLGVLALSLAWQRRCED